MHNAHERGMRAERKEDSMTTRTIEGTTRYPQTHVRFEVCLSVQGRKYEAVLAELTREIKRLNHVSPNIEDISVKPATVEAGMVELTWTEGGLT